MVSQNKKALGTHIDSTAAVPITGYALINSNDFAKYFDGVFFSIFDTCI